MQKTNLFPILILTVLLSGCFADTPDYTGLSFPKTPDSNVTFQESAVSTDCSAFAHLLMSTRMGSSGQDIAGSMQKEAQILGANLVLIGMAREMVDEELEIDQFEYYGPEYVYNFNKTWLGWKFGFDEWNDADEFINLGVDNWGNEAVSFDSTLLIQAVFLRCGEERTL